MKMTTLVVPSWLPWTIGLVALAAVVLAIAVVLTIWLRRRKSGRRSVLGLDAEPDVDTGSQADDQAIWWSPENRRRSCYLVTGEARSGASSLIGGLTGRGEGSKSVPEWRAVRDLLLYDVPGASLEASGGRAWDKCLRALTRRRASRPLDGIILTVSAPSLAPSTRSLDSIHVATQIIRERLDLLRKRIGFVLPVYVVVTQCDSLPGFSSFVTAVGDEASSGMLGWSSDRRLDAAFSPEWVGQAFTEVSESLGAKQLSLVSAGGAPEIHREALQFPRQLELLREPLAKWVDTLFRVAVGSDPHLLRGVYFCGRDAASGSSARAFSRDLFEFKAFREGGLARVAGPGGGSRRWWVIAGQAAAAGLAVVLGVGTWSAYGKLAPVRDNQLEPLLEDLTQAVSRPPIEPGQRAAERALNFLGALESLDVDGFGSIFMPRSWSDPVGNRMERVLSPAFEALIVETCRRGLEQRILTVSRDTAAAHPEAVRSWEHLEARFEDDPKYLRLLEFLRHTAELDRNLARYGSLNEKTASPAELLGLLEYLSRRQVPAGARLTGSRRFRRIFEEAQWPDVQGAEQFPQLAAERAEALGIAFIDDWLGNSPLPGVVKELAGMVDSLERGTDVADGSLEQIEVRIAELSAALEGGDWDWVSEDFDRARWGDLGDKLAEAPFATEEMLAAIDAAGVRRHELLFDALETASAAAGGPIVEIESGKVRVADPVRTLGTVIARLRSFADPRPVDPVDPIATGAGYLWSRTDLQEAAAVENSYRRFLQDTVPQLPERFRYPIRRLAASRVRNAAIAAVVRARAVNPAVYRPGADPERTLLPEILNLVDAAEQFEAVGRGLETLGAPAEREKLRRTFAQQVVGLLQAVELELGTKPAYAVQARAWDGVRPLSLFMFDARAKEEVTRYLDSERKRVTALADKYAQPLFASLDKLGIEPDPVLAARWNGIRESLVAFAAARPANSVRSLERFAGETLDQIRLESGCAVPGPEPQGADVFAASERSLRSTASQLCRAAASAKFDQVAAFFNQRLAGHYPFTSNPRPEEGEQASPGDVSELLAMIDAYGAGLETVLGGMPAPPAARSAAAFLRQLAVIRPLFPGGATPLAVSPEFRANRGRESGGNQIMEWVLAIGDQSPLFGGPAAGTPPAPLFWRPGDRTRLAIRYALNSPWVPVADPANKFVVAGRQVTFDFHGPWSVIEMLRAYPADPSETAGLPHGHHLLRLRIPNRTLNGQPAPTSLVFVRLLLEGSSTSGPGKSAQLRVPNGAVFPVRAPLVGGGGAIR